MDSSLAPVSIIIIVVLALLAIYIQVLLIRWVFKIEHQLDNQRAMVWLLIKLCEKSAVAPEEIQAIIKSNSIK